MQALRLGLIGALLVAAGAGRAEIKLDLAPPPVPQGTSAPPGMVKPDLARGKPADLEDILLFRDQDTLHGKLLGIDSSEYGLKWKHRQSNQEFTFALSNVDQIILGFKTARPAKESMEEIHLTNGDVLQGKIVALNEKHLVLDTWYAGKVNIARPMLKKIIPNAETALPIYEGPNDLDEWTIGLPGSGSPAWQFKNGVLNGLPPTPIGKLIEKLPDKADFQFDAAWNRSPAFAFIAYTDTDFFENCEGGYLLQTLGSKIFLKRIARWANQTSIGEPANCEGFDNTRTNRANRACFNLLVDKDTRTFHLLINGKLVNKWTDPNPFGGKGKCLGFVAHAKELNISNIRVSEWDGALPKAIGKEADLKEDQVRFVNADTSSGKLQTVSDRKVKFQTAYDTIDIPFARISEVVISTEKAALARQNQNDIRAVFAGKGAPALTFQLLKIEQGKIHGESENFGKITVLLGAFRLLHFNIYNAWRDE
jgi:hypothetical protein